tara:strand:- start:2771 stop:3829 length:1059 start_codon:yes stop_codon:yes gene_type:complete
MLICYLRSSSIGTYSFCQQKYLISYVLGLQDKENSKAIMGTVVHKCMETLGNVFVAKREGKRKIKDEIFNHTFKELEDLEMISRKCFDYYAKNSPQLAHKLDNKAYIQCHAWFLKALAFEGGRLNPLNQDIDAVEQFFDITIDKPWAKYKYEVGGEIIEGNLSIKGTIDVIARESDGYYQILDYKTGKRINWATGAIKEQKDLEKDPQLLLYYYALKNMFPDREYYVSIYYINDSKIDGVHVPGGLFDICFDESDYAKAEQMLKDKFEEIRDNESPKLLSQEHRSFKCKYLCAFIEEYKDTGKTICHHIQDEVKKKGVNQVVAEYGDLRKINHYSEGGGKKYDLEDKASDST